MKEIREMFIALNERLDDIEGRIGAIEDFLRTGHDDLKIPAMAAKMVSDESGFSIEQLRGPRGMAAISNARQDAYLRARQMGASLSMIGRYFNRDHTTIMYGSRKAEARAEQ